MKQRFRAVDVARGIAMICIILGHLGSMEINRVVFTFHVPIFFLITGYFTHRVEGSTWGYVQKKARTLLVPYAVTCCVIILLAFLSGVLRQHDFLEGLRRASEWVYASVYGAGDSYTKPFRIKEIGALWFLWATFWGSLILYGTLRLKAVHRIAIILSVFFLGRWSRELFWFPLSIQAGCSAALFMYLGWCFRQCKENLSELPIEEKIAGLIFALIIWISFIRDFRSFWLVHCDIGRGAIDVFGSLCACTCVLVLSGFIDKKAGWLAKLLAYIGRYSVLLLSVHIVELNLFPWFRWIASLNEAGLLPEAAVRQMLTPQPSP